MPPTDLDALDFPPARRVAAGLGWGLLWGGGISVLVFPLLPTSTQLVFVICCINLTALAMGVSLYWNAAREPCPDCGKVFTATPNGSRCPNCGLRVRAVERRMLVR